MSLLRSDHPVLATVARYFFELDEGKKVRPVMVLLVSHAVNAGTDSGVNGGTDTGVNAPQVLPTQMRLAEICEMIHTASLFHDDVLDKSDTRRGVPSVNKAFGNKMAILAGDFLLARASICLARLRDVEVVEVMSSVIEHLVKGEVMQMKVMRIRDEDGSDEDGNNNKTAVMEYYMKKNFYKTASLMANGCMSAAILGNHSADKVRAAYLYGKHVGCAFQLIDDVLDFEGGIASTGKPALADLQLGISTAPVLFAAEEYNELYEIIERKFEGPGDIDYAVDVIFKSNGLERTKVLAKVHAEKAVDAIMDAFEPSPYRDALVNLANKVITRKS
jgi:geranylgeranyl pyrophosphate synthase